MIILNNLGKFLIKTRAVLRFAALLGLAVNATPLCQNTANAETKKAPFAGGPKTISSKERVTVLMDREISSGKSYIILKISVPTDSKVNAFLLSDPPRVVVDFEGASVKKSEDFSAPENDVIKQVRVGAHPSKIRFVLDMRQSTPPQYEWQAGKRQAILKFVEGTADTGATPAPVAPQKPAAASPVAALPTQVQASATAATPPAATTAIATQAALTHTPTAMPTAASTKTPTLQPTSSPTPMPTPTSKAALADIEPTSKPGAAGPAAAGAAAAGAAAANGAQNTAVSGSPELGDLEKSPNQPKVATTFTIKGYKFEYLQDKTPVVKIILNKPNAQAQISKVDEETYKVEIKDCGLENEDLDLPQFPPHDFLGFVMVISEVIGKNTEISISVEEGTVLGSSVHDSEIWIKKP
jgi:hypothetical protein